MNLYEKYKKINKLQQNDVRDINKNRIAKDFESILETAANSYDIKYFIGEDIKRRYFEEDRILIDDSAQVSKTKIEDSKKVLCRTSSKIEVGTYINWNDIDWLVISEDLATTGAYKKFTILPCYLYITRNIEGRFVDYPVAYKGSSSNAYDKEIGMINGKLTIDITDEEIIIPNIEEIREITSLNKRIMINSEKVYKVKKEDTFLSRGVVYLNLQQDVLTELDSKEFNIADYKEDEEAIEIPDNIDFIKIQGDKTAKIGSIKEYVIDVNRANDVYEDLAIEILPSAYKEIIEDINICDNKVSFKVIKNTKNINKKILIKAILKVKDMPTPLIYPELEPNYVDLEEIFEITIKGII